MQYMVQLSDGQQFGPADLNLLMQWAREQRIPQTALLVPRNGGDPQSVLAIPELAAIVQPRLAPPTEPGPVQQPQDEGVSVLIPYKNGCALAAYYTGIFSILPLLGIVLGITAVVLGILGLKARRQNPNVHGAVHAWIGIVAGGFFGFVHIIVAIAIIISIANS